MTVSFEMLSNAVRFLSIDAVEKANSGHPGMPMGMADIATVLWRECLSYSPAHPHWVNRDRFVLSNGHGAMLLYAVLHLTGFDLSLSDLQQFRQLGSPTPGHPEYGHTPGVETTTGPLGQGIAMAVGMAIAERKLAATYNRSGFSLIDYHTYVFAGDGCLMEGISHEACSLAGTLGLGNLIVIYDDNGISIDGEVSGWFTEDVPARFAAYGWQVLADVDGHDPQAIRDALALAKSDTERPTLLCAKTHIGYGSPNRVDTASAHGAPLGAEEVAKTRAALDWSWAPFEVPEACYAAWDHRAAGEAAVSAWEARFDAYRTAYPELAEQFIAAQKDHLSGDFAGAAQAFIEATEAAAPSVASRQASRLALEAFSAHCPGLLGGSADLSGSNCTDITASQLIARDDFSGNYLSYGVREFAMAAIANGLALSGMCTPYVGTFLVFSDYARNAIRLSALMKLRVIYVLTHDSIGLGEDGPTHQPIEHMASLRAMPHLAVWRPADAVETAVAWQQALQYAGPSALVLSRQGLPHLPKTSQALSSIARGGYVLWETPEAAGLSAIIIATGSEVQLAITAAKQLADRGVAVRVVSMPCVESFLAQSDAYQQAVLPREITARVVVEAGVSDSWYRFVGRDGAVVGLSDYGQSAPAGVLFAHFNITAEAVVGAVEQVMAAAESIG